MDGSFRAALRLAGEYIRMAVLGLAGADISMAVLELAGEDSWMAALGLRVSELGFRHRWVGDISGGGCEGVGWRRKGAPRGRRVVGSMLFSLCLR